MKSSCIPTPKHEPLVIIHQWQVDFCNGNHCAAALLQFFVYWHDIRLEIKEKNHQANAIAEKHGDQGTQDESLYQFHTREELRIGLLELYSADSIRMGIDILVKKGAITTHRNPNPRYAFDNTTHFLLHPDVLIDFLEQRKIGIPLPENPRRLPENPRPSLENRGTIPETTTEITSETISKSHSSKKSLKPPPPDEIQLVREITLKYPPKDLWPAIERKVKGKTKEQIGACYEAWRLKGYSPTNFAWLEWLESGIPQNGYHKPPSKDPTVWPSADLLIDLYNELTPDECPAVDTRSPARLQKAEACLALIPEREYWVEIFKQVGISSYLRGKKTGQPANFDWILATGKDGIENYVKIHDGGYHD